MDHEVLQRPSKIFDWLLNSSPDYFGLHQGKNVRVTMRFPKTYFKAYIIHLHGPTGFAMGEAKEVLSTRNGKGQWQKIIVIIKF